MFKGCMVVCGGFFLLVMFLAAASTGTRPGHVSPEEEPESAAKAGRQADTPVKPSRQASDLKKRCTRDEFRRALIGRTRAEVTAMAGKPRATQLSGELEIWDYADRTVDPVTGKVDQLTAVEFDGERVTEVHFTRI